MKGKIMNRRGFFASIGGALTTLLPWRVSAESPSRITFVTVGGDPSHLTELHENVSDKDLSSRGISVPEHFAILTGPLEGIYWPRVVSGGRYVATLDILLAHHRDEETVWMSAIKIRNGRERGDLTAMIAAAIDKYPTKDGWHIVKRDGGYYPTSD